MTKDFVTKDSGERQEYKSGFVRDTTKGKPRFDLIWQPMLYRLAMLLMRGAEKYGVRNWEQNTGTVEEEDHFKASFKRHEYDWFNELNPEEDHFSAMIFNMIAVEKMRVER
jgi:hypothetical protein